MKFHHEHFDSIHSYMSAITTRPKNSIMSNADASKSGSESFTGTKSWSEALDLLENGYDKPLEKIKNELAKDLKVSENRPRRRPINAVVGYVPNVPNYLLGIPEQMIRIHQTPNKVKAITINYAITNNCGTEAKDLERGGIAMLNVVNRLELSGIRVNLNVVVQCTKHDKEWQVCSINLKNYREQLDIKKICFPLAHPSMFRRMGFAWLERSTNMNSDFSWGYGHSISSRNDEETIQKEVFKDEFFIAHFHVKDLDYNVDKILELIKS